MPSTAERASQTPFFSAEKSYYFYLQQRQLFDVEQAQANVAEVLKGDIRSIGWEATRMTKPYEHKFQIIHDVNGPKLVHESDHFASQTGAAKDLLEGFKGGAEKVRRCSELQAAINYRQQLLDAQTGETVLWVSPKSEAWEVEAEPELCMYTQTQLNVAEKQADGSIHVRQFQTEHLNTSQAAVLLNKLTNHEVIQPESDLDDILVAVGKRVGPVDTREIQNLVDQLVGRPVMKDSAELQDLEKQICRLSEVNSRRLVQAFERHFSLSGTQEVSQIESYYHRLLADTLKHSYTKKLAQQFGPLKTGCGVTVGSFASESLLGMRQEKWAYHNGDCVHCSARNTRVGPCDICVDCEKVL